MQLADACPNCHADLTNDHAVTVRGGCTWRSATQADPSGEVEPITHQEVLTDVLTELRCSRCDTQLWTGEDVLYP